MKDQYGTDAALLTAPDRAQVGVEDVPTSDLPSSVLLALLHMSWGETEDGGAVLGHHERRQDELEGRIVDGISAGKVS